MPVRLALLALLVLAPAASAATVEVREQVEREYGTTTVYGEVVVTAAAGETNAIEITYSRARAGDSVVIRDPGAPLTAGSRCAQLDAHAVKCDGKGLDGITGINAELGDLGDRASYAGGENGPYVVIEGGAGDDALTGRSVQLEGGDGNDVLRGGAGKEGLDGGRGDDVLDGQAGDDYIDGGAGDDTLRGGEGNDSLLAGTTPTDKDPAGADHLDGGPGRDTLDDQDDFGPGPPGPDTLIGGEGVDEVDSYILRRNPVTVDLTRPEGHGEAGENDTLVGLEDAVGGRGDDTLIGNDVPNRLDGEAGQDVLRGGGGADHLVSGVNPSERRENASAPKYGPDRVFGDAGDDLVETLVTLESEIACGDGDDRIVLESYSNDRAPSSRGPLVSRACERMRMTGDRRGVQIIPFPTAITRDSIVFSVRTFSCCAHRMELQTVQRRPRLLAEAPLRRKVMRLKVGRAFARRARSGATFRGKITKVARNRFVWRVRTGGNAF